MYKIRIQENIKQFGEVIKLIFPKGKKEIYLFSGFVIFYLSYSLTIALNSSVIDFQGYPYDMYFSFDNPIIYNQGYVYHEGHPLMKWILYPFLFIGNVLGILFTYKAKTVFLVVFCSMLVSMSIIYVYRYLRDIIRLNGYILSLLTLSFGFFSTNMILCFTPESFTLSIFLLTFTIYYYSLCMSQNRGVTLLTNSVLAIGLGGITLTNFAKGIAPMFFAKENKKTIIRKILITGILFAIVVFAALLIEYSADFFAQAKYRLSQNVSLPSKGVLYEKVFDMLFAIPILSSNIIQDFIYNDFGQKMAVINMDFFRHWWQYAFGLIILVSLAWSMLKNYKLKYVQILLLMLAVDVVIHIFLKYGLRDAFIYGGHWIFVVPILFGWLYSILKTEKQRKIFSIFFGFLFLGMTINNIYQIVNFIDLAMKMYPPLDNIVLSL